MLSLLRKHATSWLIKVALFLIAIVFIFWGGYSYTDRDANRIARVNDHYIQIADFNQSYDRLIEMYRRQLGDAFSDDLVRQLNLKRQALDMMIERYLIGDEAQKLGLVATPDEVRREILALPVFQTDGKFDQQRYVALLRQNRLSPEEFEQQLAGDLTLQKVQEFIKRQTVVTDDEILAELHFNNDLMQLSYVLFDPEDYEKQVVVEEKAVEDFFKERQESYRDPEKRKFFLVLFRLDDYKNDTEVTPDEVQQYYEENREKYHRPEEVRAGHILFRLPQGAPEAEVARVRADAEKVLKEARAEGADFAELAKKYSQGPTAPNGGDLGYFGRNSMVPEFANAAFNLKAGEIGDLVRTPFGFHIIKVEDVRPEETTPLDEVRDEIQSALQERKARDIAFDKARDFSDLAFAQKDIQKAAEMQKLQVTRPEAWITQGDALPGIEGSEKIMSELFALHEKEGSNVLEADNGFVVAQVQAIRPPEVPPLEKIRDRVERDYRLEQSRVLAEKNASDLLKEAKSMKSLEKAAKEKGLEVKESGWFSRQQPDKNLRLTGEAQNLVFQLQESHPYPEAPLDMRSAFVVCQLKGRKPASDETLNAQEASLARQLYFQKENQLWQSWVDGLRRQAEVEIYQEP